MRSRLGLVVAVAALAATSAAGVAAGRAALQGDGLHVVMVTFRGCEDACRGFQDYLASTDLDVEVEVRDIARDGDLLPGLVDEVERLQPDLLVTWGTTVTRGMLGTIDDHDDAVNGIPAVFMIVADPVGAEIVAGTERSGRPLITGTLNRVPEETQLRVLADYRPFTRLGLVYNDTELNAVLKADEIKRLAAAQGFEVVERVIATDPAGDPLASDIPAAVADIAAQDVDFLYLGSSSFLLDNADTFTLAALDRGVAVATAYEAMVRDSHALLSVSGSYYSVGQLAGLQAYRILAEAATPGDLEIAGLDRFVVQVNIGTAHELKLYPPMLLLRYAEVVGSDAA